MRAFQLLPNHIYNLLKCAKSSFFVFRMQDVNFKSSLIIEKLKLSTFNDEVYVIDILQKSHQNST
jgi:hypothetical protein